MLTAVAGAVFHVHRGGRGQKVEVCYDLLPIFYAANNFIGVEHAFRTSGRYINSMEDRFPYKSSGVDKNGMRTKGGVLLVGLQAFECQDGLWIQLLELDMMGPLKRIHNALDPATTGQTERAAIWSAVFTSGGVMDRVLFYLATFRDSIAELMKSLPRAEVAQRLAAQNVRYILVGDTLDAPKHEQVAHLKLLKENRVRCPVTLHGTSGVAGDSSRAPRLGEHNTWFHQTDLEK